MVKLGIICEGESETIVLKSEPFVSLLRALSIELIAVQETGSKNQFFGGRFEKHKATIKDKGAEVVMVLFDLDKDECPSKLKESSDLTENEIGVIAITEFESWYLADNFALSKLLEKEINVDFPESFDEPIKEIVRLNDDKSFGKSKPRLAQKMLRNGFSIENAAKHPNCDSAKYFIKKLKSLSN